MTTIKLYGPSFSSFLRTIRLLCQYKGLPHQVTLSPFGEKTPLFSVGHAALHPFKKIPVLIDGDFILPESSAMAHYLDTKPGPAIFPSDDQLKATTIAQASMIALYVTKPIMGNVVLEFAMPKGEDGGVRHEEVKQFLPDANKLLNWVSDNLGDNHYFIANQFTLCDALLIPVLDYLTQLPSPYNIVNQYPNLQHYIEFHQSQSYSEGVLGKAELSELKS